MNRQTIPNPGAVSVVMDPEANPLRELPRIRRFQMMLVLSMMWSIIFSAAFGAWYLFGELVVGHALVLTGVFVTAMVFGSSRRNPRGQ